MKISDERLASLIQHYETMSPDTSSALQELQLFRAAEQQTKPLGEGPHCPTCECGAPTMHEELES